jgi:hypothetical protein
MRGVAAQFFRQLPEDRRSAGGRLASPRIEDCAASPCESLARMTAYDTWQNRAHGAACPSNLARP